MIATWKEPPGITLRYTVQPTLKASAARQEWKVSIANNTAAAVSLNSTDITFNAGNDKTCLFTDTTLTLNTGANISTVEGMVSISPTNLFVGTLKGSGSTETVTSWDVNITGVVVVQQTRPDGTKMPPPAYPNPTGLLLVPPKTTFEVVVYATAGSASVVGAPVTVTIVENLVNGDKARLVASVNVK